MLLACLINDFLGRSEIVVPQEGHERSVQPLLTDAGLLEKSLNRRMGRVDHDNLAKRLGVERLLLLLSGEGFLTLVTAREAFDEEVHGEVVAPGDGVWAKARERRRRQPEGG